MKKILSLTLFFVLAVLFTEAQTRVYYEMSDFADDMHLSLDPEALATVVEMRCALPKDKMVRGTGMCSWGLRWNSSVEGAMESVYVETKSTDFGDMLDRRYAVITVKRSTNECDSTLASVLVNKDVAELRGYSSLALEWRDELLNIYYGAKSLSKVLSVEMGHPCGAESEIVSVGDVDVEYAVVESYPDPAVVLRSGWSASEFDRRRSTTTDYLEGEWGFFDRETDDKRARLGGRYTLACVADGNDGYLLLYLSGAEVNASAWKPLMIKGRLSATQYENNYDLKWYDSMMEPMSGEDYATVDVATGIMTLDFPIHRCKLRLAKRRVSRHTF